MSKPAFCGLLAAALVVGLVFRLARLDTRPMHHDEANQAVKFGALLETGEYRYDRADHHGPTLYYLTLPSAWLRGQSTLAALDETTVRAVPAVFGAALILLFALLAPGIGRGPSAASACLAAVSPALVYYSRFYIQESLFAFFSLAFVVLLGRYAQGAAGGNDAASTGRSRRGWLTALGAGLLAGLAMATKETWLIVVPASVLACILASWGRATGEWTWRERALHLPLAIVGASVVVVLFYTSFFRNPGGLFEWAGSFAVYGARGLTGGAHEHGWTYYLGLLTFSHAEGTTWTEGLVLGLALAGAVFACRRRDSFWPRYLALYSLLAAAAFSVLPYKTPWNLLPFYAAFVGVAGYGFASLLQLVPGRFARVVALLVMAVATAQLGTQAWRASFRYAADPRNPYVYVQTTPDFLRLVDRVKDVAATHADGTRMPVMVVAGPYEQWPLPWYLRRFGKVGYWPRAENVASLAGAPIIVASQENTPALTTMTGDSYVSEFYGLRPGVLLTLYIERGAWQRLLASKGSK